MKNVFSVIAILMMGLMIGCAHGHKGKKCCGKKKHHHGHHHNHDKMWEKLDTDKDGSISRKEYDAGHPDMFASMDSNKDGKVTKDEAKAFHASMKDKKKKKGCCGK